jgi:hypothetical protein
MAKSFLHWGRPSSGQVGDVAVFNRRGGDRNRCGLRSERRAIVPQSVIASAGLAGRPVSSPADSVPVAVVRYDAFGLLFALTSFQMANVLCFTHIATDYERDQGWVRF